ncbi:metal tolerance protein 7 isoform X4 [Setaria italica]|uniref:metal tolerance protein 7 isoform X4 n=1 Tax=Setaria italica TaxID=4555 RepID=UPI000BE57CC6|nr:metal tolerance protein 7 isoform X4 [Setaria italica]
MFKCVRVLARFLRQHILMTPLGKKKKDISIAIDSEDDLSNVNAKNIMNPTFEQLPKEVRQMLEERKKKRDAEDLQAAIASFEVDRRGTVKKIKEIDFASTSNNTFDTPPLEGIIVFASIMGTLGFQVLIESGRQLITQEHANFKLKQELWMVGSMSSVAVVKFFLMLYCRTFKNEIVRAYAQDHFFDVITNSVGLVAALLAVRYKWWMDPVGAILIALYTITTWARTVLENVGTLIGKSAPAEYLTKLTYLIWNHHEEIQHIDTVRAYTFGTHYFVEVDIVLPGDMPLSQAHDIGESLQEKLEQLPEVERAFVHVDFEFTHRPEHKAEV